ncbi:MAG: creatininase family protein, partial [Candidatus Binatia bacterium]
MPDSPATWREAHALLTQRAAEAGDLVAQAATAAIPALPFMPNAARCIVATGVGSSAAHARLLAHLLRVELGLPARAADGGEFVAPLGDVGADALVVFSQGLSPNGRLPLARAEAWLGAVLVTAVARDGAPPEKRAALSSLARAHGVCVPLPGGLEYGTLLRLGGPLAGYAVAFRLADAIGRAAGRQPAALTLDVPRLTRAMAAAAAHAGTLAADALDGEIALLASGGYGALAGNLQLKLLEGLLEPLPPVWDLVGFAHGPFQALFARRATLLMLQRAGAPEEAALLERLRAMLDPRRHRLLLLPATLPGALALFEHEALLNQLVLRTIAARGIDQARWPGLGKDAPLYDVTSAPADAAPQPHALAPSTSRSLAHLTWPEVERLQTAGCRTAVIPLGSTEQHGPHLPFATDTWIADALAERFCQRVGDALHLPALPLGCAAEHAGFAGTLSLRWDSLRALLLDVAGGLAQQGFSTLFVFSAHGGNDVFLRHSADALAAAAAPATL